MAGSSMRARLLLRNGLGTAGCHAVKGQRTRLLSRGVLCRMVSIPRAAAALGEGVRVLGRAAPVASKSRRGVWSARSAVADAAVVARHVL